MILVKFSISLLFLTVLLNSSCQTNKDFFRGVNFEELNTPIIFDGLENKVFQENLPPPIFYHRITQELQKIAMNGEISFVLQDTMHNQFYPYGKIEMNDRFVWYIFVHNYFYLGVKNVTYWSVIVGDTGEKPAISYDIARFSNNKIFQDEEVFVGAIIKDNISIRAYPDGRIEKQCFADHLGLKYSQFQIEFLELFKPLLKNDVNNLIVLADTSENMALNIEYAFLSEDLNLFSLESFIDLNLILNRGNDFEYYFIKMISRSESKNFLICLEEDIYSEQMKKSVLLLEFDFIKKELTRIEEIATLNETKAEAATFKSARIIIDKFAIQVEINSVFGEKALLKF